MQSEPQSAGTITGREGRDVYATEERRRRSARSRLAIRADPLSTGADDG